MSQISVADRIDARPLTGFQLLVAGICGFVVFADGFDSQFIGYLAPYITADWGLQRGALGPTFSAGLFGMTLGAMLLAPLADTFGRRPLILVSTLLFGLLTAAASLAANETHLLILRFFTGLGMGCTLANAIALTSEYCPSKQRASVVMIMTAGMSVGSICGGLLVSQIAPVFGWRTMCLVGGALALAMLPVIYFLLPESIRFLTQRESGLARAQALLERIDPGSAAAPIAVEPRHLHGAAPSVKDLLDPQYARFTILLWLGTFLTLIDIYLISNWLPTTLHGEGLSAETAAVVATFFHIGAVIGTVIMAFLSDRYGTRNIMIVAYLLAAVALTVLALQPIANLAITTLIIMCAGAGVVGGQIAITATGSIVYPPAIRSTGVGWGLGVGRIGSIAGPMIGATLLNLNYGGQVIFATCAVPVVGAAICVFLMKHDTRKPSLVLASAHEMQPKA